MLKFIFARDNEETYNEKEFLNCLGSSCDEIVRRQVESGIDTGGIYLKSDLDLSGSAKEIFVRSSLVIYNMISEILIKELKPSPQIGEITIFKRRLPYQSSIMDLSNLNQVYNYIRMLDCEGYPNAYIETKNFKFDFTDAKFDKNNNLINANVRIFKK